MFYWIKFGIMKYFVVHENENKLMKQLKGMSRFNTKILLTILL